MSPRQLRLLCWLFGSFLAAKVGIWLVFGIYLYLTGRI